MEDTTWFEAMSEEDELICLAQLMLSSEENAKTEFKTLLNLLPVDLVTTITIAIASTQALQVNFFRFITYL